LVVFSSVFYGQLHTQKPGSVILRIDKEVFRGGQKNIALIVSYKFKTIICHRPLAIKVKPKSKIKGDEVVCTVDPKLSRQVKYTLIEFLKKLVVFVSAIVQNKNWIEKELQSTKIERLLSFREFIIFPSRDRIIIIRKTLNQAKVLSHKDLPNIINVKQCGFYVYKANSQGLDSSETDFNKILRGPQEVEDKTIDDHEKAVLISIIELELETLEFEVMICHSLLLNFQPEDVEYFRPLFGNIWKI